MNNSSIIVTCAPKVSQILSDEVQNLGYSVESVARQSVTIQGTFNDTLNLNLHLRTATRVLFLIKSFKAQDPDQLYEEVKSIVWEDIFDSNGYVSIKSFARNEHINDSRFANLRVKDAIVDRFQEREGRRPDSGSDLSKTVVFLHWDDEDANIYIDTSGETIAKHGYRKIPLKAPMIESLAAATIQASVWDKKSNFINPMCGSGTLAIEAALLATNNPPGLHRNNYGFMHVKLYDAEVWEKLKTEARSNITDINFKIIATDINYDAIKAAETNAKMAGVGSLIEFKVCAFQDTPIPPNEAGVVFLNPGYGERIGEERQLEHVYGNIGDFFKDKCKGYTGYIFTGNLNLAKKVGLRAKRRLEFYNSKIDCRLLEYELYAGSKKKVKLTE